MPSRVPACDARATRSDRALPTARLAERRDVAPCLAVMRLDPEIPFTFVPGQYCTIGVDGIEACVAHLGVDAGDTAVYACGHPGTVDDVVARRGARGFAVKEERYWPG